MKSSDLVRAQYLAIYVNILSLLLIICRDIVLSNLGSYLFRAQRWVKGVFKPIESIFEIFNCFIGCPGKLVVHDREGAAVSETSLFRRRQIVYVQSW